MLDLFHRRHPRKLLLPRRRRMQRRMLKLPCLHPPSPSSRLETFCLSSLFSQFIVLPVFLTRRNAEADDLISTGTRRERMWMSPRSVSSSFLEESGAGEEIEPSVLTRPVPLIFFSRSQPERKDSSSSFTPRWAEAGLIPRRRSLAKADHRPFDLVTGRHPWMHYRKFPLRLLF